MAAELALLRLQHDELIEASAAQAEEIEELSAAREELEASRAEIDSMHEVCSPRPEWEGLQNRACVEAKALARLVPGGSAKLFAGAAASSASASHAAPAGSVLQVGETSAASASAIVDQLVEAWNTLAELQYRLPNEEAHFPNPGDGPNVPAFLRLTPFDGMPRLKNKRLPKREVEMLVREFWNYYDGAKKRSGGGGGLVVNKGRRASIAVSGGGGGGAAEGGGGSMAAMGRRATAACVLTPDVAASIASANDQAGSSGCFKDALSNAGVLGANASTAASVDSAAPSAAGAAGAAAAIDPVEVLDAFLEARALSQHKEKQLQAATLMGGSSATAVGATANKGTTRAELDLVRFAAVELALNLLDGCRRHGYDADLELFLDVVSGRVPASAHAAQLLMVDQLRNAFAVTDRQSHDGASKGEVRRHHVGGIVRSVFPRHSEMQISQLLSALERDVPGTSYDTEIKYVELFKEDQDFNQSAFVERARGQALRAPREYVAQIESAMKDGDESGTGVVTWEQASAAIRAVDPTIPEANLRMLVAVGIGIGAAAEGGQLPARAAVDDGPLPDPALLGSAVDCRIFCRRLLFVQPERFGPPPKAKPGGGGGANAVGATPPKMRGGRRGSVQKGGAGAPGPAGAPPRRSSKVGSDLFAPGSIEASPAMARG